MNNDITCFICFEENIDTILRCCNKRIHGSCVKQWWNINNIRLEESVCPHCQQPAILEHFNSRQVPLNDSEYIAYLPNIISDTRIIIPDNNFNLTNEEIQLINLNSNNIIPRNMFYHEINSDEDNNIFFNICTCLCIIILIILIILILILFGIIIIK